MASWAELQDQLAAVDPNDRAAWMQAQINGRVTSLAGRANCNVVFYASAWLQKPGIPGVYVSVSQEAVNGFMSALKGLDFSRNLMLLLHTPGGSAEAAETLVDYLRSKFGAITAVIPTYCMSAGTMIALASHKIIMGRQSQLGPTDPQLIMGQRAFSAHSIVQQFDEAKGDIAADPRTANAWYPVLQPFGPALLQEARKAMAYGERLVESWLTTGMFAGDANGRAKAKSVTAHFGGSQHGSHGRRINREEARTQGLNVEDMETDATFQDDLLSLYHLITFAFEQGPAAKVIISSNGAHWVKNIGASTP